jgi:hypothetical protein
VFADLVGQAEQLHVHAERRTLGQPLGSLDELLHRAGPVDAGVLARVGQDREHHLGRGSDVDGLGDHLRVRWVGHGAGFWQTVLLG